MSTLDPEAAPPWLRPLLDALLDVDRTELLPHHLEAPPLHARRAAILMLFGETAAHGPDVLLAERASTLRSHAGQVAFPGGGTECGDSGAVATALREAEEETGLDPTGVVPLAVLPELYLRSEVGGEDMVTRRYALLHSLEHTALHVGHLQITRQLWEARGAGTGR